jgi:hypothetical protein
MDKISQSLSSATFTAFYRLSVEEPTSTTLQLLEVLIKFFFEVTLPFSLAVPNSDLFPIQFFRELSTFFTHHASQSVRATATYVCVGMIVSNFLYMGYLIHFYTTRRSSQTISPLVRDVMQHHILWACETLYVPYISIPLNYITCDHIDDTCTFFSVPMEEVAFLMFIVIFHTLFSMIHRVSVFDWSPLSHHVGAKAHSRVCIAATLCRAIITVAFELVFKTSTTVTNFGLIIFCMLYNLALAYSFWHEVPFYWMPMNHVHVGIHGISFMAALSIFLRLIFVNAPDSSCLVFFSVGSLLLLPAIYLLTDWRVLRVDTMPVQDLASEADVDIKLRRALDRMKTRILEEDYGGMTGQRISEEIEQVLHVHGRKYRDSFKVNLIGASYEFLFKKNTLLAMKKLLQVVRSSPFIFDVIPVEIRLRYFAEFASNDNTIEGLETCEEQLRLEKNAIQFMFNSLAYQAQFWNVLSMNQRDFAKLEPLATKIEYNTALTETCLSALVRLAPANPLYHEHYARFLKLVMNDELSAHQQMKKVQNLKKLALNSRDSGKLESFECIIVISGDQTNIGQILEVNHRTCQLFAMERDQIMGRNITSLMAKPYVSFHNARVRDYIENKKIVESTTIRDNVIYKTSHGFVSEARLVIKEYPNFTLDPSICFLGSLIPGEPNNFCIVKKKDLIVWDMSQLFYQCFKPPSHRVHSLEYTIQHLFPNFATLATKFEIESKFCTTLTDFLSSTIGDKVVPVKLSISNLNYLPNEFYKVQFHYDSTSLLSLEKLSELGSSLSFDVEVTSNAAFSTDLQSEKSSSEDTLTLASSMGNLLHRGINRGKLLRIKTSSYLGSWFVMSLILVVCASILVECFLITTDVGYFRSNIDILSTNIAETFVYGSFAALTLGNLSDTRTFDKHDEERIKLKLKQHVDNLLSFERLLYSLGDKVQERTSFLKGITVNITNFEEAPETLTLQELCNVYVYALSSSITKDPQKPQMDPMILKFLLNNDQNQAVLKWEEIMDRLRSIRKTETLKMYSLEDSVILITVISYVMITLSLFLPNIYKLLKGKLEVYNLFLIIEKRTMRKLHVQRLQSLSSLEGHEYLIQDEEVLGMIEMECFDADTFAEEATKCNTMRVTPSIFLSNRLFIMLIPALVLTTSQFIGAGVWWRSVSTNTLDLLEHRLLIVRNRDFYISRLLTHTTHLVGKLELAEREFHLHELANVEQRLFDIEHALYFGNESMGVSKDFEALNLGKFFLNVSSCSLKAPSSLKSSSATSSSHDHSTKRSGADLSVGKTYDESLWDRECLYAQEGILRHSPHAAIVKLILLSSEFRTLVARQTESVGQLPDHILDSFSEVKELASVWIPPLLDHFDQWFSHSFGLIIDHALSIRRLIAFCFISLAILASYLFYLPEIKRQNLMLDETRALLTMIPVEVLDNSPVLKQETKSLINKMLSDN